MVFVQYGVRYLLAPCSQLYDQDSMASHLDYRLVSDVESPHDDRPCPLALIPFLILLPALIPRLFILSRLYS